MSKHLKDNHGAMISWISDADLMDYYLALPSTELKNEFLKQSKNEKSFKDKARPDNIVHLTSNISHLLRKFGDKIEELHLITNRLYDFLQNHPYEDFMRRECPSYRGKVFLHNCADEVTKITDLPGVYTVTQKIIADIKRNHTALYCNLSSGVGVTTAALVMLASAYFDEYHLLQNYQSDIDDNKLPEDFSSLIAKRAIHTENQFANSRIIGQSDAIQKVKTKVYRFAPFDYSVLILGPNGTGKSTIAKEIHDLSSRKNGPFVSINCGSLTPTLLESRLFGHLKGSYTNATSDKDGEFKRADGGTIFLDEIADCSLEMQVALLHVLQPLEGKGKPTIRRFHRMGETNDTESDVRVIAATNKDIKQLIREGKFREDLYYRIAVCTITMPSLSQMKEDIELLATSFLKEINAQNKSVAGFTPKHLSAEALQTLKDHIWTGNVRELIHSLQQAAIMADGNIISSTDFNFQSEHTEDRLPPPEDYSLEQIKADLERRYINAAIDVTKGNKAKASRLLGLKTPQNLESRIKALHMKLGK